MALAHPADLLDRIAQGERDAFGDLYDATQAKLFSVCLLILRDRARSEEALQDCYLKVWRRAGSFDRNRASAMSWLIAIARNAAIDLARKSRGVHVGEDALAAVPDDGAASPEREAVAADEAGRLHKCLDELETEQSGIIKRAYMGGLSYSQVAEAAGKPLGTVKSMIRRGLAKLKECLQTA